MKQTQRKLQQQKKRQKEKQRIKELEKENQRLRAQLDLKTAVIETIEDVNQILSEDEEGKKLLWTTNFPHNVKPEIAEEIQKALKKKS